jgi:hypothetical protein
VERFRKSAGVLGLVMVLSGAPSLSHATTPLSDDCKTLLVLIAKRIDMLQDQKEANQLSGEAFWVEVIRLKKLAWTAVYVHHASTSSTCRDLIAYVEQSVSPHTP